MPAFLSSAENAGRYSVLAILLHWLTAVCIIVLVVAGLVMTQLHLPPLRLFQLYQWHKSIGITALLLSGLRLAWRLTHRPPALPETMPLHEQRLAGVGHGLLYLGLFLVPLTGWAVVSASPFNIPTLLFGLVPWPHLPILVDLSNKAAAEPVLKTLHGVALWGLLALVAGHAGAALRHHWILRDSVLTRMLPAPRLKPARKEIA